VIRLFAALAMPETMRERLALAQQGLGGRLVPPENFHLSLAFFGETPEPQAADLHAALLKVRTPGFSVWLDGVGAFGGVRPRSIHARVRQEPALTHLQASIAQAARDAGIVQDDARYTPHVTLSRYRPGALSASNAAKLLSARGAFLAGPARMQAFHLYRSDLGRTGPAYAVLASYPLGGSAP
jgi:2'-5' RNA ligase